MSWVQDTFKKIWFWGRLLAEIDLCLEKSQEVQEECQQERRILHSANLTYLKYGDASKYWHQPMLPYPLMKHESLQCRKSIEFDCPPQEIGRYHPDYETMEKQVHHEESGSVEQELFQEVPNIVHV